MNAIEIKNLTKTFGEKVALNNLSMTVPLGSIYGFIGENGSGKSTTEKIICGLMLPSSGSIKLLDKDYTDEEIRNQIGVLIEQPGCFKNYSVWNNLMLQATNLGLKNKEEEIRRVLKLVRMEGSASNKYKNCSLGMKQRIGIAMALLGKPKLLVLDEPINALDADGMRIMREVLIDITKNNECSVLVSSHILSELEKIATHYGIIKNGQMIVEMTSEKLDEMCPIFVGLITKDINNTLEVLQKKYSKVKIENEEIRVYDETTPEEVVSYLYSNNIIVSEIRVDKINLEEFYTTLMAKEAK